MVRLIQNFTVKATYKCSFVVIYHFHKSSFFCCQKLKKYAFHSYVRKVISANTLSLKSQKNNRKVKFRAAGHDGCLFRGMRMWQHVRFICTVRHKHSHSYEMYMVFLRCVWKILKSNYYLSCLSSCASVCVEQLGSHWLGFDDIWYLRIFKISVKKIPVDSSWTRIMCSLCEDVCNFFNNVSLCSS